MMKNKMLKNNILMYHNKIVASKIVYCDSFIRQGTGLIFRTKSSVENTAWVFRFKNPRKVAVTMFFVFFPIDIVFLDRNNCIVELKENLKPFRNYTCKEKIYSFVELKQGIIKKYSIKTSQRIVL
jgi:uncharacterized membrane protein (UPF0127 family)